MDVEYLAVLIVAAAVIVPTLIAVGIFWGYRKWQDRDGRRSPVENRRIFGAGEQLRKRIDDQSDDIASSMAVLFFLGPYILAVWALQRVQWSSVQLSFGDWFLIAFFVAGAAMAIARIHRNGKARRRCVAGLRAELFTAQELNRLMASGCTVLHDIPAENFNIDHVVIGPHAVYLVETKSVRKPRDTGKQDHFKVIHDGDSLRFPDFVGRKAIAQARRQASWLSSYLKQATGQVVPVIPALALPGWWIEGPRPTNDGDVRVFNPAGRGANFMAETRPNRTLDEGVMGLVTQALVMRYPVEGQDPKK